MEPLYFHVLHFWVDLRSASGSVISTWYAHARIRPHVLCTLLSLIVIGWISGQPVTTLTPVLMLYHLLALAPFHKWFGNKVI